VTTIGTTSNGKSTVAYFVMRSARMQVGRREGTPKKKDRSKARVGQVPPRKRKKKRG
jgi:hypothetical protein